VAVALLDRGEVAWLRAFGVRSTRAAAALTPDDVFEMASLSKPVFAAAVLRFARSGGIDLDAPLAGYLSAPYLEDPRLPGVTARHVLSHTSGLPNSRRRAPLAVAFPPGERFAYSGEGFLYLQHVIDRVTGGPLDAFVRQQVFDPLGMRASSFAWRSEFAETYVSGHDLEGAPVDRRDRRMAGRPDVAIVSAAASLHASLADYARFVVACLNPSGAWITRDAVRSPQIAIEHDLGWGLGWGLQRVGGRWWLWHWGNNQFVRHLVTADPASGRGVICLTNGERGAEVYEAATGAAVRAEQPALRWLRSSGMG
jgi:CubicO group peptidase (beta-lactamase class C family)